MVDQESINKSRLKTFNQVRQRIIGPFETIFRHSAAARILDNLLMVREFDLSEAEIARKSNLSSKTVSNELQILSEEGIVKLTRKIGRANMYRVTESYETERLREIYDSNLHRRKQTLRDKATAKEGRVQHTVNKVEC